MTLDSAALLASVFATSVLSLRAPSLRPHALAALACAALYLARTMGGARVAVAVFATWPAVAVWLWLRACRRDLAGAIRMWPVAFPFVLYAAALAYGGHYLAPVWPWPLLAPNALPLLFALAGWRRPRTWAERAAYVLPASCAADLVTAWAGAPGVVGAWVGVATWAAFAGCCVAELRGSRARM